MLIKNDIIINSPGDNFKVRSTKCMITKVSKKMLSIVIVCNSDLDYRVKRTEISAILRFKTT